MKPFCLVLFALLASIAQAQTSNARLINLSVRAFVPDGKIVTPGFVIRDGSVQVLIRASGPALADFGVTGTLPNPKLTLYSGSSPVAANDDWSSRPIDETNINLAIQKAGAFPLVSGSKDAALLVTLLPGAYTVAVTGTPGTTGEVLIEVYEVK